MTRVDYAGGWRSPWWIASLLALLTVAACSDAANPTSAPSGPAMTEAAQADAATASTTSPASTTGRQTPGDDAAASESVVTFLERELGPDLGITSTRQRASRDIEAKFTSLIGNWPYSGSEALAIMDREYAESILMSGYLICVGLDEGQSAETATSRIAELLATIAGESGLGASDQDWFGASIAIGEAATTVLCPAYVGAVEGAVRRGAVETPYEAHCVGLLHALSELGEELRDTGYEQFLPTDDEPLGLTWLDCISLTGESYPEFEDPAVSLEGAYVFGCAGALLAWDRKQFPGDSLDDEARRAIAEGACETPFAQAFDFGVEYEIRRDGVCLVATPPDGDDGGFRYCD